MAKGTLADELRRINADFERQEVKRRRLEEGRRAKEVTEKRRRRLERMEIEADELIRDLPRKLEEAAKLGRTELIVWEDQYGDEDNGLLYEGRLDFIEKEASSRYHRGATLLSSRVWDDPSYYSTTCCKPKIPLKKIDPRQFRLIGPLKRIAEILENCGVEVALAASSWSTGRDSDYSSHPSEYGGTSLYLLASW